MLDPVHFGLVLALVSGGALLGVASSRLGDLVPIPAPALFLAAAAVLGTLFPGLSATPLETVERVVTVALVMILFDGGLGMGLGHFRPNAAAITWVGVAGTAVTAIGLAVVAHLAFGFDWRLALLLATALSPTDPAVVFSVLGRQEVTGRSGVLLEGESGANDPVGIALMASLLSVSGGVTAGSVLHGLGEFALQMGVGGAVGVAGGVALIRIARVVSLPSEGLYPLRVLASAGVIFGVASLAHGSGFLAVFVAGIVFGDERAPFKREVERFHSSLASLAEIVAFTVLGLTVDLHELGSPRVWAVGLGLAAILAFVLRPLLVGAVLAPIALARNERIFVLFAGLKGAVPLLLGTMIVGNHIAGAGRAYGVDVVAVMFSVLVQGGLLPVVLSRLRLPTRPSTVQPWALGLRLSEPPANARHYAVAGGSPADGAVLADLPLGESGWLSLLSRGGQLVQISGKTRLQAGDEVVVLADPDQGGQIDRLFVDPQG